MTRAAFFSTTALAAFLHAAAAFAQAPTDATVAGDEIIVTGQRAQQERAIEMKRDAIGVIDVAASDEIGRLPDRNVAEVVERLPGVGVTYDQGEGRFVAVRGVPGELNGYTINGFEIGNPDGATRKLPLDIISGQLLNRVEVAKVKTAAMDGQGIGASINLVTQTAFDFEKPFNIVLNAQAGYQELNKKKVPLRGDASVAARFGADEQFGIVLGGSYSDRTYFSYGFYPDDWRPVAGAARGGLPTNIKYTNYTLERERIGASGSFDWHATDTQSFYIRGVYSKFTEHEVRPRYQLDFATDAIIASPNFRLDPGGVTGTVTGGAAERRSELRLNDKTKSTLMISAGGQSIFDALTLDYAGAYVHNKVTDYFPRWQFRDCKPATVSFDFSQTLYTATPSAECTASQLTFRTYTLQDQRGEEDVWQGRIDAKYALAGIGEDSFVQVGAKYRQSKRDFDQNLDTYDRGTAANRFTLAQFGLAGPTFPVYPDNRNTDRLYLNGPTIDPAAILAYTQANLNSAFFVRNAGTTLSSNTLSDFNLKEKVAAGYADANLNFGAVTITAGLRYERTDLDVTGFQVQNGAVASVRRKSDYDDWLPSIIVRAKPSGNTVFRAAWSRSLGRPEYSALAPSGSLSFLPSTTAGQFDGSISYGNPDLKPYRSDNFDATAEWYFAKGGLIAVSVFAKDIKNPIFSQTMIQRGITLEGRTYTTLSITQPFNADRGDIIGIEGQYQQQFTMLPGLLSGFGVSLTGALMESTLRLPTGRTSAFPQQSNFLYGAELFYQKGIVEASVAYHNTGKSLLLVGGLAYQDQYNDDLRRLDAKASFALFDNVRLFFEAQNLTDEPTRQFQGQQNWITQNERYGRTFYAGVSAKF